MTNNHADEAADLDCFPEESEPDRAHLRLVRGGAGAAPSQIWSPPIRTDDILTTSDVLRVATVALAPAIEARILETLRRQIVPGEGHATGNAKREQELQAQFVELDVTQSFHLKRRLEVARADDPLSAAFHRLVIDRRNRLLQILTDARRRAMTRR